MKHELKHNGHFYVGITEWKQRRAPNDSTMVTHRRRKVMHTDEAAFQWASKRGVNLPTLTK